VLICQQGKMSANNASTRCFMARCPRKRRRIRSRAGYPRENREGDCRSHSSFAQLNVRLGEWCHGCPGRVHTAVVLTEHDASRERKVHADSSIWRIRPLRPGGRRRASNWTFGAALGGHDRLTGAPHSLIRRTSDKTWREFAWHNRSSGQVPNLGPLNRRWCSEIRGLDAAACAYGGR
jgi:hypothetical protein